MLAFFTLATTATPIQNGTAHPHPPLHSLRLFGGVTKREGELQVYHDGRWGNICDDGWDMKDAHVACRQLGYSEAQDPLLKDYDTDYTYTYRYGTWRERGHRDDTPIWMDNVRCKGTETKLTDCAFLGFGLENCGHYEDVALRCKGHELERTMNISITFFCVSTGFSLIAIGLAFMTLMRVMSFTRGPLMHPFAQVVELHMPHQPVADAELPMPAKKRNENTDHETLL